MCALLGVSCAAARSRERCHSAHYFKNREHDFKSLAMVLLKKKSYCPFRQLFLVTFRKPICASSEPPTREKSKFQDRAQIFFGRQCLSLPLQERTQLKNQQRFSSRIKLSYAGSKPSQARCMQGDETKKSEQDTFLAEEFTLDKELPPPLLMI